jgi:hypothetical protein
VSATRDLFAGVVATLVLLAGAMVVPAAGSPSGPEGLSVLLHDRRHRCIASVDPDCSRISTTMSRSNRTAGHLQGRTKSAGTPGEVLDRLERD